MNPGNPHESYRSPLETRNASRQMRAIWSDQRKFSTWRRIWLALAEAQREVGLDISQRQIDELRAHLDEIDFAAAARFEARLRHDVMAHVHTYGEAAPAARAIIHLGATSQDIVCNADLLLIRDSLQLIAIKLARVIDALGRFAKQWRDVPALGMTHYQPAQPTTVGKRAAMWAYDFVLALEDIEHRMKTWRLRGVRGATGTQASFLSLLNGDAVKVRRLNELFLAKLGWPAPPGADRAFTVTGQTYPRLVDAQVINSLAIAAAAAHKCATDLRLLASRKEIEEPFEDEQIGSSAMPYKRNPMRCERACGLARFVISMAQNPLNTAATQWLERTLDDSSNRRLSLPEPFLALDGVLDLMHNIADGLMVYQQTIRANLMAELPFMASENILMAAVKAGADRQEAHERLRQHSHAAGQRVKSEGTANDLLDRLRRDAMFSKLDLEDVLDPAKFIGLAPQQVDEFIARIVEPIRQRYGKDLAAAPELRV